MTAESVTTAKGSTEKPGTDEPASPAQPMPVAAPSIRKLTITRFRGIENLVWRPGPGMNVILGGGDVGKSTILDAVALLLSPTNSATLSINDYWCCETSQGFCIEAVMSIPLACEIGQQAKATWPWEWDGSEARVPADDADAPPNSSADPVYKLQVRGTDDFDLVYEVVQPDGSTEHFSASVRRKIGLVRLGGEDRNDRDLRLVQGSALDRLLSDKTLRSRLGRQVSESDVTSELTAEAKAALSRLDTSFAEKGLPSGLDLAITGGQGLSLNALIGLTARRRDIELPLSSWGAGTRRLAALQIASAKQGERPITVVDEVERGLEPYRQRALTAQLQDTQCQVLLTTHSATIVSAAPDAALWYLDSAGSIGQLASSVAAHQTRDPETFLARLAIVAEGATEVGFIRSLLERAIGRDPIDYGIWITDGGGNERSLQLLENLAQCNFAVGGFADDEGNNPERWRTVRLRLADLLFRWQKGCIEENIIPLVPAARLEEFIRNPDGEDGDRLRTLADRIGLADKDFASIAKASPDLTSLVIQAAIGAIPKEMENASDGIKKSLRKHSQKWFKSREGGRELAEKLFEFDLWPKLEDRLLPFVNAVLEMISLPKVPRL